MHETQRIGPTLELLLIASEELKNAEERDKARRQANPKKWLEERIAHLEWWVDEYKDNTHNPDLIEQTIREIEEFKVELLQYQGEKGETK